MYNITREEAYRVLDAISDDPTLLTMCGNSAEIVAACHAAWPDVQAEVDAANARARAEMDIVYSILDDGPTDRYTVGNDDD